jgi:alkylated DNA repair protein (DNA oxidative demethylase)
MQRELFEPRPEHERHAFAPGAMWLRGFARAREHELLTALAAVTAAAPCRQMSTPGGRRMSVAMSNCGAFGWVTDARGYRYQAEDPLRGHPWPPMPAEFAALATRAAAAAGYADFAPDACLVNRYQPGARMTLHQDSNERDFTQPIVSVSRGLPARLLLGGAQRADKTQRLPLAHGDVLVWGGPSRRFFHGVLPVKEGVHPLLGRCRINLTFRRAR